MLSRVLRQMYSIGSRLTELLYGETSLRFVRFFPSTQGSSEIAHIRGDVLSIMHISIFTVKIYLRQSSLRFVCWFYPEKTFRPKILVHSFSCDWKGILFSHCLDSSQVAVWMTCRSMTRWKNLTLLKLIFFSFSLIMTDGDQMSQFAAFMQL